MGSFSIWHWVIVAAVIFLIFGRGAIPRFSKDIAESVKVWQKEMKPQVDAVREDVKNITHSTKV
jgi:sec-independent protein translocase protein TatA